MENDFDQYKDSYREEVQNAINFIGQDHSFFIERKACHIINIAERLLGNLKNIRVLDVGCGMGLTDHFLIPAFENKLYGIDVAKGMIEKASKAHPSVHYQQYDGKVFPFPDNSFDLTFTIGVMHHMQPDNWVKFVKEMERVTKESGLVVVFEHNPFNLVTRYVVNHCKFDANAVLLSQKKVKRLFRSIGLNIIEQRYILLFPFIWKIFSTIEHSLGWLPLGA